MKHPEPHFDAARLDVEAFAKAGAELAGELPLSQLPRLADLFHADTPASAAERVRWQAHGETRKPLGGEKQPWIRLQARGCLSLECQRCLQPVAVPVEVDRHFLFVHGEDAAAQLDADSEDDVLALTRALDLVELIEDELLLALPVVPRHEVCAAPLPRSVGEEEIEVEKPNPFAALSALKRGRATN